MEHGAWFPIRTVQGVTHKEEICILRSVERHRLRTGYPCRSQMALHQLALRSDITRQAVGGTERIFPERYSGGHRLGAHYHLLDAKGGYIHPSTRQRSHPPASYSREAAFRAGLFVWFSQFSPDSLYQPLYRNQRCLRLCHLAALGAIVGLVGRRRSPGIDELRGGAGKRSPAAVYLDHGAQDRDAASVDGD